ncbi:nucleotide-binding universal stress UspA family protein [Ochrobactrum daejeonense]|uniref:Nucleotide-binding universal stress UspA family protein n=1 Tax=Brucella daejeonensis TaxID=659015 RepID=A0A7W9B046_9HYPH|nr:universal stress protein [Brucella daejeonensis]MBB5703803.1 nucleotide-binding universal stress UspA family protein [Brucella daejeonensis]NKB79096.1 universal stress protein [Brucella daejeonensis]
MYKNILVTTDGSEFAERGLIHAFKLAHAVGAKVTVLTITAPYSVSGLPGGWTDSPAFIERFEQEWNEYADKTLARARELASEQAIEVHTLHVVAPHPATSIIETSTELRNDLIVMASHGRRGLKGMLLGSQTFEVLTRSTTPILVVK